jgi:transposase
MSRYDLTDFEWGVIEPLLPNKPRGVPRVDDRRVLNGIFWVLRSGAPWRDLPERYGPRTTCYNRFVRWRKAGVDLNWLPVDVSEDRRAIAQAIRSVLENVSR